MIILDTNQLWENRSLDTPALTLLAAVAESRGHRLAVSAMVEDEYLARYGHEMTKLVDELKGKYADLQEMNPEWRGKLNVPLPWKRVGPQKKKLEDIFVIIPTPQNAAYEALLREAHRRRPASTLWDKNKQGSGARDVVVWLTALDQLSENEVVYFVSRDVAAFGKGSLHPELQAEADALAPGKLNFCSDIFALLDQLTSGPTDKRDAGNSWVQNQVVQEAVSKALLEASTEFDVFVSETRWPVVRGTFVPTAIRDLSSGIVDETRMYSLEQTIWASGNIEWNATADFECVLVNDPPSSEARIGHIGFRVPTGLVVKLTDSGEVIQAQVKVKGRF